MPTYEYVCMSCGRHVEVVQSFSDEPLRTCEHCGGPLKRVFHPVGIVLKGSGFYSTDNRSSRSKAAAAESKKESGSESSSESKGSESKTSESKSSESKDSGSKGSESKSKPDSSSSKSSPKKSDGGSTT